MDDPLPENYFIDYIKMTHLSTIFSKKILKLFSLHLELKQTNPSYLFRTELCENRSSRHGRLILFSEIW